MRHHHADAAARPHPLDRLSQRAFALRVEVGVRLIEDDEERIAVQGPSQPDTLALAGRKPVPAVTEFGIVTPRKVQDHLVDARGLRGRHDIGGRGTILEPGDVLGDGPGKQLGFLGQIADMGPEPLGRPLIEGGAVEPHLSARRGPHPNKAANQAGLARGRWPDHAERLARHEAKAYIHHRGTPGPRRHDRHALDRQARLRSRQIEGRRAVRHPVQGERQSTPALARRDEAAPVGDGEFGRCQGAGDQDRRGDDDAAAGLIVDHQPGSEREHAGLQDHAAGFRRGSEPSGDIGTALLGLGAIVVGGLPAPAQRALQPQRGHDLDVAPRRFGERLAAHAMRGSILGRPAGGDVGQQGHGRQQQGATDRGQADQRVDQEAQRHVGRKPGQIEQGGGPATAQEPADLVEVAQGLAGFGGPRAP